MKDFFSRHLMLSKSDFYLQVNNIDVGDLKLVMIEVGDILWTVVEFYMNVKHKCMTCTACGWPEWPKPAPKSYSFHQQISSPASVTNIDVTTFPPAILKPNISLWCGTPLYSRFHSFIAWFGHFKMLRYFPLGIS